MDWIIQAPETLPLYLPSSQIPNPIGIPLVLCPPPLMSNGSLPSSVTRANTLRLSPLLEDHSRAFHLSYLAYLAYRYTHFPSSRLVTIQFVLLRPLAFLLLRLPTDLFLQLPSFLPPKSPHHHSQRLTLFPLQKNILPRYLPGFPTCLSCHITHLSSLG